MNAFELVRLKSLQLSYIVESIKPLLENDRIELKIDDSIVVTYDEIKTYLNSISKSFKRYGVFKEGNLFKIIRTIDNFDLRTMYAHEVETKPTKKQTKKEFSVESCALSDENMEKVKAATEPDDSDATAKAASSHVEWLAKQAANGWE